MEGNFGGKIGFGPQRIRLAAAFVVVALVFAVFSVLEFDGRDATAGVVFLIIGVGWLLLAHGGFYRYVKFGDSALLLRQRAFGLVPHRKDIEYSNIRKVVVVPGPKQLHLDGLLTVLLVPKSGRRRFVMAVSRPVNGKRGDKSVPLFEEFVKKLGAAVEVEVDFGYDHS